jgi:two-component system, chemotaxis family, chemotaxis protein CheY
MAGKKILVVDDSASVRQQVSMALVQAGFSVLEAVDGLDGVEKINGNGDLAAVICDVNMPRMNGLELLEKVRAGGLRLQLPIVMLTTEGQPALMQRAKLAGAKGWIIKPFKADMLIATMKKLAA